MTDRVPGAPGQYTMVVDAATAQNLLLGEAVTVVLTRNDQPLVEGTPYNKASVLPDDLASIVCPGITDPTPADAYTGLLTKRYAVVLSVANWSNNRQTVSVPGVTSDPYKTDVFAAPATQEDNYSEYVDKGIRLYAQNDNSVVFSCDTVPDKNVTVNLAVRV